MFLFSLVNVITLEVYYSYSAMLSSLDCDVPFKMTCFYMCFHTYVSQNNTVSVVLLFCPNLCKLISQVVPLQRDYPADNKTESLRKKNDRCLVLTHSGQLLLIF